MKTLKTRILSLLLAMLTVFTLLPTAALAASTSGTGIAPTTDSNRWTTRLTSTGASYSYRPPMADGKYLYCLDLGYSYRYGTASFLNSYSYTSATGKDADTLLKKAVASTGLSEMNATVLENAKWMMSYIADYTGEIPGSLFMALQTYLWDNQSDKSAQGDTSGDIDAGGFANADTYATYVGYYNWMLAQKAKEDQALQAQVEDYAKQGVTAAIVESDSGKRAVLAQSSVAGRQAFFAYHATRTVVPENPGAATPDEPDGNSGITIKKVDADTGKGLAGAQFKIEGINTNYQSTFTAGANGSVIVTGLAAGSYKVTEIVAPAGYVADATPQTVYYYETTPVTLTFKDHSKTTITLTKTTTGGKALSGCVFNIYRDGQIVGSDTTDASGKITVTGVVEGLYSFVETAAPDAYAVDPTPHEVYVDVADGSKTYTVSAVNAEKPDMEIVKLDGQTGAAIAGAVFSVKSVTGAYSTSVTTGADGKAKLSDLDAGVYVVREKSVPKPYVRSSTEQTVAMQPGKVSAVTSTNYVKPGLEILKQDIHTGAGIEGVTFRLEQIDGAYTTDVTTDVNGRIFLPDLPAGSYRVTEIAVPDDYILSGAVQTVALEAGTMQTLNFYNAQKPGLVIVKTDADGNALPGVVFGVKLKDGSSIGTFTTDTNGKITIPKLNAVWYTVTELYVGEEFILDTVPRDVLLRAGETYTLTVSNNRKPDLKIIKKDADTGAFLEGASYKVKRVDSSTVTSVTTGADGTVLLEHLNPGVYEITETIPPVGYLLPETVTRQITLEANKTGEVVFENHMKPTLTVNKVDSITKDPIKGAKFHITYASNNTFSGEINDLGTYFTDENGQIQLSKLTDGWYRVTEMEPAAGYAIKEPATQECYIQAGTGKVLTFENVPLSALVIKKVDADSGAVLQGAKFRVRYLGGTSGTGGTIIGEYTTSVNGTVVITGLKAGTYIVEEAKAPAGYEIDETPQTVYLSGKDQDIVTVEFSNDKHGGLIVQKIDSVTKQPLSGAQFQIVASDGSYIPNAGGAISSNGIYITDENGQIHITGIKPGTTLVVTETKAPAGYVLDTVSQTVQVNQNDTQTLTFTNTPIKGLTITKTDESSGARLKGAQLEVRRMNGEVLGVYTTDSNGVATLPELDAGWYTVTELKAPSGYLLDSTPHNVEVKTGVPATLTITNHKQSGILIRKVDADTGDGLYGATFILYDGNHNPIGQYTSAQDGYVSIDENLEDGRYYLREMEAPEGYIRDDTLKTIYVRYGSTSEIKWRNTAVKGQIQITKRSADYNPTNGLPAGTLLAGAVFEVYSRAGNKVDTIVSGSNGLAISKQLPLGRYTIRETKAPAYYAAATAEFTAEIEFSGQIVRLEVADYSVNTGVSITKTGPKEVVSGQPVRYVFSGIGNTGNAALSNFYWRDTLPAAVRLNKIVTGSYNYPGNYKIVYRVNGGAYQTLADNLSTAKVYTLDASAAALGLASNQRVTEVMFVFGQVPGGFAQVETPMLHCAAISGLTGGSSFVNVADAGGVSGGQWVQAVTRWVTTVYGKKLTLPKTGY